jgi:hypothetical protein
MGPATTLSNSRVIKLVKPFIPMIEKVYKKIGPFEFLPKPKELTANPFCANMPDLCLSLYEVVFDDNDYDRLNRSRLPILLSHTPAGGSIQTAIHFAQVGLRNVFRKYDFGPSENNRKYGQSHPPEYDLSKITAPMYLYSSSGDKVSTPMDVIEIAKQIGNMKKNFIVTEPKFNHYDFFWAMDAYDIVYKRLLDNMKAEE